MVFALDIATILSDLVTFSFTFVVGLAALIFYLKGKPERKLTGMLLIAVAFFLRACLLILLGSSVISYLLEQGISHYDYAVFSSIVGLISSSIFIVLMILGLYLLYQELTRTSQNHHNHYSALYYHEAF